MFLYEPVFHRQGAISIMPSVYSALCTPQLSPSTNIFFISPGLHGSTLFFSRRAPRRRPPLAGTHGTHAHTHAATHARTHADGDGATGRSLPNRSIGQHFFLLEGSDCTMPCVPMPHTRVAGAFVRRTPFSRCAQWYVLAGTHARTCTRVRENACTHIHRCGRSTRWRCRRGRFEAVGCRAILKLTISRY